MPILSLSKGGLPLVPHFVLFLTLFLGASFLSLAESSAVGEGIDQDSSQNIEQEAQQEIVIDSIQSLFSVLSSANKFYQYHSLLTYEANGYITTFKLKHRVENEVAYQQLMFMDGPDRQVFRRQGLSGCLNGATRWGLWPTAVPTSSLSAYDFRAVGFERVANRQAIMFDILPKDELRYGYRYSIDRETGLILKVITYDNGKIIERLQAVSLELGKLDESLVDEESGYVWRVPEVEPCHTEQFQSGWTVDWLPEGFESVGNRVTAQGEQVLIFADGLVSVSVFIINDNSKPLNKATARHGATVVVVAPVSSQANRSIAVVGEVPTITARRIAVSVKPQ
ncbi:MAG: MucB/RseB C-terminal domain-containing protein [Cellvibrionaceae bacterium]